MKKTLVALGISLLLFTPTVMAANLETRTYDDGGDICFPITISNVAWDSIEKIPNNAQDIVEFFNAEDIGQWWINILNFGNETYFGDISNVCKFRWTSNNDSRIWVGAAAPCTVKFDTQGEFNIEKIYELNDDEIDKYDSENKTQIGNKYYRTEPIDCSDEVILSEGLYRVHNYNPEALNAGGYVYWVDDYILNVINPNKITNADAYVKLIEKSMSYKSEEDYRNKTNGIEREQQYLITFKNQVPVIIDDRTLVPMRDIFEALDCEVTWDDSTKTVTAINKHGTTITLVIGENKMLKNDIVIELDVAPQIINDSTMIPVRAVSEALDLVVEWDDDEKIVSIIQDETK